MDLKNSNKFLKERKKTRIFFNLVAFIYPIIEKHLFPEYVRALCKLNLDKELNVLDIATGTGILANAFYLRGHRVRGIDFSEKLLKRAKKRYENIDFINEDLINLENIETGIFDIVSTGYFLHGLSPDFRKFAVDQMARIAKKFVIVFDYCCDGGFTVRMIEKIEGSDYLRFVSESRKEEFGKSGLKIIKEYRTSDYGKVWLLSKLEDN